MPETQPIVLAVNHPRLTANADSLVSDLVELIKRMCLITRAPAGLDGLETLVIHTDVNAW